MWPTIEVALRKAHTPVVHSMVAKNFQVAHRLPREMKLVALRPRRLEMKRYELTPRAIFIADPFHCVQPVGVLLACTTQKQVLRPCFCTLFLLRNLRFGEILRSDASGSKL